VEFKQNKSSTIFFVTFFSKKKVYEYFKKPCPDSYRGLFNFVSRQKKGENLNTLTFLLLSHKLAQCFALSSKKKVYEYFKKPCPDSYRGLFNFVSRQKKDENLILTLTI
ncbi:MAG: hypothetical protein Q8N66_18705, partial [Bacteroidota bacterium]|nr:hypothetical protein [Bacteroidota bacterium]